MWFTALNWQGPWETNFIRSNQIIEHQKLCQIVYIRKRPKVILTNENAHNQHLWKIPEYQVDMT